MRLAALFFLVLAIGCRQRVNIPQNIPQKQFVVFVAYSSECPISQRYTKTLNNLFNALPKDSFQWVFLKVNADETWDFQWNDSLRKTQIISGENALKLAKELDFTVYPEVAICSGEGQMLYRGAIDDRAVEVGQMRRAANVDFFKNALTQCRAGMVPNISNKKAIGCFIDYSKIH